MKQSQLFPLSLSLGMAVSSLVAQQPAKVDFARDVQPIFQQNCVMCHGPMKQNGGLRLDRRSSALDTLNRHIIPGNIANSLVYHRVADTLFGPPMPPTGELKPEQVATIKAWIEQGADWPDALANEEERPPVNPEAVTLIDLLHQGRLADFMKKVTARPALLNARGPNGSTPFMFAVLYADAMSLEPLLKLGADPNLRNDAGATALMWGVRDLAKTRVLLAHNAQVNVVSANFHTPLMIAAREPGKAQIVKLLLDHGANTMPNAHPDSMSSPLLEAATAGDAETFALLLQHGAVAKDDAEPILVMAITTQCAKCVASITPQITDKSVYTSALLDTAYMNDVPSIKMLLEHGADPAKADASGRTALMYSATSDKLSLEAATLLVAHGADVNARDKHPGSGDTNLTPLDMAKRHGTTEIVQYLRSAGARETELQPAVLHPRPVNDMFRAIQDSLPALQRSDVAFTKGSGCVSCHSNNLTTMTVALAQKHGFKVDDQLAAGQVQVNVDYIARTTERLNQNFLVSTEDNFSDAIVGYFLMGLDAAGYKADLNTDIVAMFLRARQRPDGSWPEPLADGRQPICLEHIGQTAKAMRAMQLYAPKLNKAAYQESIARAAAWLATEKPYSNDDRSWKLIGLAWAGTHKAAEAEAMRELLAIQKPDGGWSDMASMESTAYATGKSLVALRTAGLSASNPAYQRGVTWLLKHQEEDGSWYVQTRALGFQPYFDTGFPHGVDQFISSAGTDWATMALEMALPEERHVAAVKMSSIGHAGGSR